MVIVGRLRSRHFGEVIWSLRLSSTRRTTHQHTAHLPIVHLLASKLVVLAAVKQLVGIVEQRRTRLILVPWGRHVSLPHVQLVKETRWLSLLLAFAELTWRQILLALLAYREAAFHRCVSSSDMWIDGTVRRLREQLRLAHLGRQRLRREQLLIYW